VLTNGFATVDHAFMGQTALRKFLADAEVLTMLDNRRIDLGSIDPKELPKGLRYVGHLNEPYLDLYCYCEVYLDYWTDPAMPVTKRLVDDY